MVLQGGPALPLEAVREQIHASIDAVVHVVRGQNGHRRVAQIAEVLSEVDPTRVRLLAVDGRVLGALARQRTAAP